MGQREKHPEPKTEEEKQRFKYRHNYPYRRQARPGDFGLRRSTTTKSTTTALHYNRITTNPPQYHAELGYHPVIPEKTRFHDHSGFQPLVNEPRLNQHNVMEVTVRPIKDDVAHLPIQTETPPNIAGPFVTVQREGENDTTLARQPKYADDMFVDYGSDSSLSEVRVLPPEEFRHLLAQVDGVDRKVKSFNMS